MTYFFINSDVYNIQYIVLQKKVLTYDLNVFSCLFQLILNISIYNSIISFIFFNRIKYKLKNS